MEIGPVRVILSSCYFVALSFYLLVKARESVAHTGKGYGNLFSQIPL
jgi:hypothetical protein